MQAYDSFAAQKHNRKDYDKVAELLSINIWIDIDLFVADDHEIAHQQNYNLKYLDI